MKKEEGLVKGDLIQIDPAHDETFGGCFMVVTEPKVFGAQGYCSGPGMKGLAYYRCPWDAMHKIGKAEWFSD